MSMAIEAELRLKALRSLKCTPRGGEQCQEALQGAPTPDTCFNCALFLIALSNVKEDAVRLLSILEPLSR